MKLGAWSPRFLNLGLRRGRAVARLECREESRFRPIECQSDVVGEAIESNTRCAGKGETL
jgi:hypothetical protein